MQEIYIPKLKLNIKFLIGKDARNNTDIINQSQDNDLWFHVNNLPSCHVIAHIHDLNISRKDIPYIVTQGALLCKQNSKYKSYKNVEIIYTRIKNVKTLETPGSVMTTDTKIILIT
jgi:predicted ribosome quality control (RQC) complex YloA/Tae2 family protein